MLNMTKCRYRRILQAIENAKTVGASTILKHNLLPPPEGPPEGCRETKFAGKFLGIPKSIQQRIRLIRKFLRFARRAFGLGLRKRTRKHVGIGEVWTFNVRNVMNQLKFAKRSSNCIALIVMIIGSVETTETIERRRNARGRASRRERNKGGRARGRATRRSARARRQSRVVDGDGYGRKPAVAAGPSLVRGGLGLRLCSLPAGLRGLLTWVFHSATGTENASALEKFGANAGGRGSRTRGPRRSLNLPLFQFDKFLGRERPVGMRASLTNTRAFMICIARVLARGITPRGSLELSRLA
jgi:hypothetical protein